MFSTSLLVFFHWCSLALALGSQWGGEGPDWKPYGPPPPAPSQGHCEEHHHHENSTETPNFTFQELWDMQNAFFTQFLYPNNAVQAKSINSSLLAENV
jgi:hypothetical protein